METLRVELRPRGGRTSRTDAWWREPAVTGVGLVLLFGYLMVRVYVYLVSSGTIRDLNTWTT